MTFTKDTPKGWEGGSEHDQQRDKSIGEAWASLELHLNMMEDENIYENTLMAAI